MVQVALSQDDFQQLQADDVNELFASLALTDAGNAGTAGIAVGSLKTLKGVMSAEDAASGGIWNWLVQRGRALFNSVWPSVKAVVCKIYEADGGDGDLKGWVAKAAAAILSVINVTAAVAILVATIALKLGLDSICASGSEQPA